MMTALGVLLPARRVTLVEEGPAMMSPRGEGLMSNQQPLVAQAQEIRESKSVQVGDTKMTPTLHPLTPKASITRALLEMVSRRIYAMAVPGRQCGYL